MSVEEDKKELATFECLLLIEIFPTERNVKTVVLTITRKISQSNNLEMLVIISRRSAQRWALVITRTELWKEIY